MSNKFDLMRDAVSEAEVTLRAADRMAVDMAQMLLGRLRSVNNGSYHPNMSDWRRDRLLAALKRELKDFNSHTYKWKGE